MCFTRLNFTPAKTAEADTIVYKILRKYPKTIRSPYRKRYIWNDKKIRKAKLGDSETSISVSAGFHSFRKISSAISYTRQMGNTSSLYIYKMIIPKGAKFYKNRTQYVSTKIRLASTKPIQTVY